MNYLQCDFSVVILADGWQVWELPMGSSFKCIHKYLTLCTYVLQGDYRPAKQERQPLHSKQATNDVV